MKIKEITLKDFKRFVDLTVTGLDESVKLVVLIGPNGCGKSSLIDAMYGKMRMRYHSDVNQWGSYFDRKVERSDTSSTMQGVNVFFYGKQPDSSTDSRRAVYVRSAYRNVPSFSYNQLERVGSSLEEARVSRMIDNDQATSRNYMRLVSQAFEDAFEKQDGKQTLTAFRDEILADIREAFENLFKHLILNSLGNPLSGNATFRFDKGTARAFAYENLSGGEKAAFDLILDIVLKRREYNNTVFCIDEPEAHMSTRLQKDLLASLYGLIPQNCQLWIATHSIGMIRKAQEIQRDNPEKVVFLDLGNKDFDSSQVIQPTKPTRAFWQMTYEIALDDLASLVVPRRIILCEGKVGQHGFDAECYNKIFGEELPDTLFVSAGGKSQVKSLVTVIKHIGEGCEVLPLTDRDRHSDSERKKAREEGGFMLKRHALENYLLDNEVLTLLCDKLGCPEKVNELADLCGDTEESDVRTVNAKEAAEKIYEAAESLLSIQHPGGSRNTFLIDHFVPLITSETAIYKELKDDIFGD